MKIFNHRLCTFTLLGENQILRFDWTAESAHMTYEDFQDTCQIYAGFAIEHAVRTLLVDVRQFQFSLPAEYDAWRDAELNPRYHKLGIHKFAYIFPEEAVPHLQDIDPEDGTFVTRFFGSDAEAIEWLSA